MLASLASETITAREAKDARLALNARRMVTLVLARVARQAIRTFGAHEAQLSKLALSGDTLVHEGLAPQALGTLRASKACLSKLALCADTLPLVRVTHQTTPTLHPRHSETRLIQKARRVEALVQERVTREPIIAGTRRVAGPAHNARDIGILSDRGLSDRSDNPGGARPSDT